MSEFNWTCPYCSFPQTVVSAKSDYDQNRLIIGETNIGAIGYSVFAIGCSNPNCKKAEIRFSYGKTRIEKGRPIIDIENVVGSSTFPSNLFKSFPDYIPSSLIQDYQEACKIVTLSPKASATLSRRCIQGMIRDFCGISKRRLIEEIHELRHLADTDALPRGVTHEGIEAIDAVRAIGNIGAHMESDINVIVEVEPNEATTLVELIENLFEEWYVARHNREKRMSRIQEIATSKAQDKKKLPASIPGEDNPED